MRYTFRSKMPTHIARDHRDPKVGDNYSQLARLEDDEAADINLQWAWNNPALRNPDSGGVAFAMHWAVPERNGYTHLKVNGRIRAMTAAERKRPISRWRAQQVADWRRGPRGPGPKSYAQMVNYCREHGGVVVGELKSNYFGTHPWIMGQLVASARRYNQPPWFMALYSMPYCRQKGTNTIRAGGQFAVIFGTYGQPLRPPSGWNNWDVTRVWGPRDWPLPR